MAVSDDDWRKFLDSTEEDPEEVETDDELEDETEDDEEAEAEKKTKKPEKGEEENSDDEGEGDDPDEEEAGDPADKGTYTPRLKQFLTKDGTLDAKKIEDAYVESGKQAVALNKKVEEIEGNYNSLLEAIKAKPEVAKALFGEEGAKKLTNSQPASGGGDLPQHPLLQHLEAQMKNNSTAEYNEFVELHPESVTDPEKARKIGSFLKTHGAIYREEHNGEIPSMKESLEAAYRYYGWDLEIKGKEDIATAAKKTAATRTTPQGKRQATKKETSQGEQFFAKKLGVKLK